MCRKCQSSCWKFPFFFFFVWLNADLYFKGICSFIICPQKIKSFYGGEVLVQKGCPFPTSVGPKFRYSPSVTCYWPPPTQHPWNHQNAFLLHPQFSKLWKVSRTIEIRLGKGNFFFIKKSNFFLVCNNLTVEVHLVKLKIWVANI